MIKKILVGKIVSIIELINTTVFGAVPIIGFKLEMKNTSCNLISLSYRPLSKLSSSSLGVEKEKLHRVTESPDRAAFQFAA